MIDQQHVDHLREENKIGSRAVDGKRFLESNASYIIGTLTKPNPK
jgi:hypothetical protein